MRPRRARNASAMLPQRFHENAVWGKWTSPFARNMLEIPGRDFQPFLSLLTFLLLFAQYGGAIINYGILTVEHGNFTGNSATAVPVVCIL